jgi:hypothetical protein
MGRQYSRVTRRPGTRGSSRQDDPAPGHDLAEAASPVPASTLPDRVGVARVRCLVAGPGLRLPASQLTQRCGQPSWSSPARAASEVVDEDQTPKNRRLSRRRVAAVHAVPTWRTDRGRGRRTHWHRAFGVTRGRARRAGRPVAAVWTISPERGHHDPRGLPGCDSPIHQPDPDSRAAARSGSRRRPTKEQVKRVPSPSEYQITVDTACSRPKATCPIESI